MKEKYLEPKGYKIFSEFFKALRSPNIPNPRTLSDRIRIEHAQFLAARLLGMLSQADKMNVANILMREKVIPTVPRSVKGPEAVVDYYLKAAKDVQAILGYSTINYAKISVDLADPLIRSFWLAYRLTEFAPRDRNGGTRSAMNFRKLSDLVGLSRGLRKQQERWACVAQHGLNCADSGVLHFVGTPVKVRLDTMSAMAHHMYDHGMLDYHSCCPVTMDTIEPGDSLKNFDPAAADDTIPPLIVMLWEMEQCADTIVDVAEKRGALRSMREPAETRGMYTNVVVRDGVRYVIDEVRLDPALVDKFSFAIAQGYYQPLSRLDMPHMAKLLGHNYVHFPATYFDTFNPEERRIPMHRFEVQELLAASVNVHMRAHGINAGQIVKATNHLGHMISPARMNQIRQKPDSVYMHIQELTVLSHLFGMRPSQWLMSICRDWQHLTQLADPLHATRER